MFRCILIFFLTFDKLVYNVKFNMLHMVIYYYMIILRVLICSSVLYLFLLFVEHQYNFYNVWKFFVVPNSGNRLRTVSIC